MKVSIVTISFNQAEYLENTIKSVVDQDYENTEYIVVDPGSTDGSREIIGDYKDRITQVILDPDKGPADGLNKGFASATGEILGFLNSDDLLLPGSISSAVQVFEQHPEIDVVFGHARIIDGQDQHLRDSYSDRFSLRRFAYRSCAINQQSTFFRAEAFRRVGGFNPDNPTTWDGELWIDMAMQGSRFMKINQFWSSFRLHPDTITSSGKMTDQMAIERGRMFRKIMGRERSIGDKIVSPILRIIKHLLNPRNLWARLHGGRIYGRDQVGD